MRFAIGVLLLTSFAISAYPGNSIGPGKHHVKAHTTKKGKKVKAHDQTNPNDTETDNWSAKGNINPETGKPGTKPVDH